MMVQQKQRTKFPLGFEYKDDAIGLWNAACGVYWFQPTSNYNLSEQLTLDSHLLLMPCGVTV